MRFFWILPFCCTQLLAQNISFRLNHPGGNQTRVEITFPGKPEFYYYMRPSPVALVLVLDGGLRPQKLEYETEPHLASIELRESGSESNLVFQLRGEPAVRVWSNGNRIFVELSGEQPQSERDLIASVTPRATLARDEIVDLPARDLGKVRIRRVVIDPGHGGWDSGAAYGSAIEKEIVLDISLKLQRLLREDSDLQVSLTRNGDYFLPLRERTLIANQHDADLFISIHANAASNRQAHGFESYYCSLEASDKRAEQVAERENAVARLEEMKILPVKYVDVEEILFKLERKLYWEDGRSFAAFIQRSIGRKVPVRQSRPRSANFSVLRYAKMPAVLLEVGYLSNRAERQRLASDSHRTEVARYIFELVKLRGRD